MGPKRRIAWEEGDEISVLEFGATEYGRKGKVLASEDVKAQIRSIGINKCARESGFDRKNFIRKLVRGLPWLKATHWDLRADEDSLSGTCAKPT
jgi:hypothetical protein